MPFDDALDTLDEPNAVFSQFLGSASMTFLSLFLSLLPLLVLSFLFLSFSFLAFPFSFSFSAFFFFSFLSFLFLLVLCFFFQIDLRLSCVCVVIDTTCNIYVVVFVRSQDDVGHKKHDGSWPQPRRIGRRELKGTSVGFGTDVS